MSHPTVLNVLHYRGELVCEVAGMVKEVDFLVLKSDLSIVPAVLDLNSRSIVEIEGYSNLRDSSEHIIDRIKAASQRS